MEVARRDDRRDERVDGARGGAHRGRACPFRRRPLLRRGDHVPLRRALAQRPGQVPAGGRARPLAGARPARRLARRGSRQKGWRRRRWTRSRHRCRRAGRARARAGGAVPRAAVASRSSRPDGGALTMPKLSDSMEEATIMPLAEGAGGRVQQGRAARRDRDRQGDGRLRGGVRRSAGRASSCRRAPPRASASRSRPRRRRRRTAGARTSDARRPPPRRGARRLAPRPERQRPRRAHHRRGRRARSRRRARAGADGRRKGRGRDRAAHADAEHHRPADGARGIDPHVHGHGGDRDVRPSSPPASAGRARRR